MWQAQDQGARFAAGLISTTIALAAEVDEVVVATAGGGPDRLRRLGGSRNVRVVNRSSGAAPPAGGGSIPNVHNAWAVLAGEARFEAAFVFGPEDRLADLSRYADRLVVWARDLARLWGRRGRQPAN